MRLFKVSHRFKTPIIGCRVMDSFVLLASFEFLMAMYGLDAIECCQYRAFSIAPRLNVMLTGVGRRLQGTCWSALICFWIDILKPYMPPYMSLCFGIVERCCNHILIKRAICGQGFFFFHIFFRISFFSFDFFFFLRLCFLVSFGSTRLCNC